MDVNISKTKEYYDSINSSMLCDCDYCKNFRRKVKAEYTEVSNYLKTLEIDIEKPFETSPLEPDENGILEYCACQYIVFGKCEEDHDFKIGEVNFRKAKSYPSTGIKDEHFVLEFYPIKLKY